MAAESPSDDHVTTKVAIVEDNPTLRQYLSELIANTPGYRCVCACESAEEALEKIPVQRPHVVLMDIHLPGESGIACTACLREKMPKIQVITMRRWSMTFLASLPRIAASLPRIAASLPRIAASLPRIAASLPRKWGV